MSRKKKLKAAQEQMSTPRMDRSPGQIVSPTGVMANQLIKDKKREYRLAEKAARPVDYGIDENQKRQIVQNYAKKVAETPLKYEK